MDDNINVDMNNKTEDVENAVKSLNEKVINSKDVEKSSEPVDVNETKKSLFVKTTEDSEPPWLLNIAIQLLSLTFRVLHLQIIPCTWLVI